MSEEVRARLFLALLGLVFGLVPAIFGWMRGQRLLGCLSAAVCAVLSAVGLPYLSVPLAGGAFYLIYAVAKKQDGVRQKKNRAAYRRQMDDQLHSPEIRESGYVENKDAAGTAWPPVEQFVNEQAARDYERLIRQEEETRKAALEQEEEAPPADPS